MHINKQLMGTGKLVASKITQLPMRLYFYFDAKTKVRVPAILLLEKKKNNGCNIYINSDFIQDSL
jgi:hypothetical protein